MAKKLFKSSFRGRLSLFRSRSRGFTLLELLVAMFVGAIISSLLLYTVVELTRINGREGARSDVQRDVQTALDFIANDLRSAVYVYDGSCITGPGTAPSGTAAPFCPGITPFLPTAVQPSATNQPVLAFWRIDPLPTAVTARCQANAASIPTTTPAAEIQYVPCISGRMYTLVVYSIDTSNPNNTWAGRARITRYQLPQFASTTPANPIVTSAGWADPSAQGVNFINWPFGPPTGSTTTSTGLIDLRGGASSAGATPVATTPDVLIDFIDTPTTPAITGTDPLCPTAYTQSPRSVTTRPGMYTCVRSGGSGTQSAGATLYNQNQEVIIYLRGSTSGKPGIDQRSPTVFTLETRVLPRGVLDKS